MSLFEFIGLNPIYSIILVIIVGVIIRSWIDEWKNSTIGQTIYYQPMYVKIMAEHCADPVWGADGLMLDLDSLPISDDLMKDLEDWNNFYNQNDDTWREAEFTRTFNEEEFDAVGRRLALRFKAECPTWTIVYFSENNSKLELIES